MVVMMVGGAEQDMPPAHPHKCPPHSRCPHHPSKSSLFSALAQARQGQGTEGLTAC